jgi:hypothetical protein
MAGGAFGPPELAISYHRFSSNVNILVHNTSGWTYWRRVRATSARSIPARRGEEAARVTAVQRIIMPFQGLRTIEAELTWGQREIWMAMVRQRSWMPIFWFRSLPTGTTLDDVAARLTNAVVRYESLRTRLVFDEDGEPRQSVAGHGELTLEVYEAGARDPADVAAEVQVHYCTKDYDFTADWPVRAAVVVREGQPSHLVTVFCHLVLDAMARDMLLRDLSGEDHGGSDAPSPPGGGMQPAELAHWERDAPARQSSAASLVYWERVLREIPARRFTDPIDRRRPRYWEAVFHSPATQFALRAIAPRAPGATATLLALFAIALARVTGSNPVVLQVIVSNRFRTQLTEVFAPVNQTGLWAVDVADTTIEDVLGRSRRRAMSTYKNAYYDPRSRRELLARICAERGEEIDLGCFFNDRRMALAMPDPATPAPTEAEVRAAMAQTTFAWKTRTDQPSERLFVHVDDADEAVLLHVWIDTHCLAPHELEAALRELDAVALTAAFDRGAPTGVGAGSRVDAPVQA